MMPKFFKDMPAKKSGKWVACVIVYNMRTRDEIWAITFNGLRRAYVAARILALWEDFFQPNWRGIDWAVRRLE